MKKVISLLLSLTMIIGAVCCADYSAFADDCQHTYANGYGSLCNELDPDFDFTATEMSLDTTYSFEISKDNTTAVYSFTPQDSRYYQIKYDSTASSFSSYLAVDGKRIKNNVNNYFDLESGKHYLLVFYRKKTATVTCKITLSVTEHEHTLIATNSNPTCGADGYTGDRCIYCDYRDVTVIPATGEHTFVNGKCKVCHADEPGYVRVYTDLELNKEYEITSPRTGETTYFNFTPTESGKYDIIAPQSHVNVVKSNNNTGISYANNLITLESGVAYNVLVTPNTVGTTTFKFRLHEHQFNNVVTPATCVSDGSSVYTCTVCKYSYTDVLPQDENAHKFVNGKCLYCGLEDENYIQTITDLTIGDTEKMQILESENLYFRFTPEEDGCYGFRIFLYRDAHTISANFDAEVTCDGEPAGSYIAGGTYTCFCDMQAGKEYVLTVHNKHASDCEVLINTAKHTHSYRSWLSTNPTCVDAGEMTYYCNSCYHSYKEPVAPTGEHTYLNGSCTVCGAIDENYVKVVTPIEENNDTPFDSTTAGTENYYSFTPAESGDYVIVTSSEFLTTSNKKYPVTKVFDENGNEVTKLSYGKELPKFYSYYTLEGGKTYEISVAGMSSQTGTVNVSRHIHTIVSDGNVANCEYYMTETKTCSALGCAYKEVIEHEPTGNHIYEEIVHLPTCVDEGYTEYTCLSCGRSYIYDYVPVAPDAHYYINGICKYCDKYQDESQEKKIVIGETQSFDVYHEDDEDMFTFVPEKDGYYSFESSTDKYDPYVEVYDEDGELLYDEDDISLRNYNFRLIGKFKGGKKYYFYFGCYYDDDIRLHLTVNFSSAEHIHNYTLYSSKSSCGRKSYTFYQCACGDMYINDAYYSSGEHNYVVSRIVAPTCVEEGYTEYFCTKCGETYDEITEPASGVHKYVDGICENCGKYEDALCYTGLISEDNAYVFESTDKLAQIDLTFTAEKSATYIFETYGRSEVSATVTDGKETIDNDYLGSGIADNCLVCIDAKKGNTYCITLFAENEKGVSLSAEIKEHTHTYKYYTIPATCGEPGMQLATCTECLHKDMEVLIPTDKHIYKNGVCTVCGLKEGETYMSSFELKADEPKFLEDGKDGAFIFTPDHDAEACVYANSNYVTTATVYTESKDGSASLVAQDNSYSGELINFKMTFDVEKGKTYYVMTECTDITGKNTGDYEVYLHYNSLKHSFSQTVTEPTCTKGGYTTFTCTECGFTYVGNETAPTGHTPVTDKAVAATFKKAGKTAGSHCADCGAVIKKQKAVAKLVSPTVTKLTAGKRAFTATWKKAPTVAGYEIQYATNAEFKKAKKIVVKKDTSTKKTIKKLSAKKKYYVRVRAYKTINGKKVYSAWSKAKTVTTKK